MVQLHLFGCVVGLGLNVSADKRNQVGVFASQRVRTSQINAIININLLQQKPLCRAGYIIMPASHRNTGYNNYCGITNGAVYHT